MKQSIGITAMKILNVFMLNDLGYDPDSVTGFFCSEKVPLQIIKKFPHLHIISGTNQKYSNFHVPNSHFYYISAGDASPEIECLNEHFTTASLQKMIKMFKGDKERITDPLALETIRIFRMFVNDTPEAALDALSKEIAIQKSASGQ